VVDLFSIRALEAIPVPPCASLTTVPILTDDHAILANLSVPILFREGEAQIPGTILIGGFVLPGGGGADHVVASHGVEWVDLLSIGGITGDSGCPPVPLPRLSHPRQVVASIAHHRLR